MQSAMYFCNGDFELAKTKNKEIPMKYYPRLGLYKASNVTFNLKTMSAYSYGWWKFVSVIDGKIVFNDYNYSNMTCKHQWKVRSLLQSLGVKVDIFMPVPGGLPGSYLRHGQTLPYSSLEDTIVAAEEYLCNKFLDSKVHAQDRYQKNKAKKLAKKQAAEKQAHSADDTAEIKPHAVTTSGHAEPLKECSGFFGRNLRSV